MANKSDLTLGLSLSDENIQVMKRFCDSVDFLKQASQSGAEVKMQWPENPTAAQSAPASAAQTTPIVPPTPAPNPAPATAAPIAPAPIPAPVVPVPSVNPTPAVSAFAPIPAYMGKSMRPPPRRCSACPLTASRKATRSMPTAKKERLPRWLWAIKAARAPSLTCHQPCPAGAGH